MPQPQDANAAANRELLKRAGASGFNSTILTSPLGAGGTAPTSKPTLLGQ